MVSVADAVRQVKDDLPQLLEPALSQALEEHPEFTWRQRLLTPVNTLLLFVTQVMHGNTAMNHLRHLSSLTFTAAAYCKARQRLPLGVLERVVQTLMRQLLPAADQATRWRGHRVWRADATSFSMPDTPELQARFGQPGGQAPGCGFPVSTLLVLCNAAGFIVKTLALPLRTHEAPQLIHLHEELEDHDVLVYDRAACSFVNLALILGRNLHAIFRIHPSQIVSFRPGRKHAGQVTKRRRKGEPRSQWLQRLGQHDQLVDWFKPTHCPPWMDWADYDALPESLTLRELRYATRRRGFRSKSVTLVTTLLDPETYPAAELAEQYFGRWDIELNFRHLKSTMKMDVLKCMTVDGVLKELAVFTLVYNLIRLVMLRAAQRQRVPLSRISFIDALRWLRDAKMADLLMALIVNPRRPDRVEPRAVKRRPKPYSLMTKPRRELRQALTGQEVAA